MCTKKGVLLGTIVPLAVSVAHGHVSERSNSATNPRSDVDHRGDLFATLKVKLPSDFTEEELDLFRRLRDKRRETPESAKSPTSEDNGAENGDSAQE